MAAVGAHTFLIVPEPDKAAEQVQILDRTGLSGIAARSDGTRGRDFTIVCEADITLAASGDAYSAAITAKAAAYKALQGTIVTITADNNRVLTNILITAVEPRFKKIGPGIGGLTGTLATHYATVRFECIDTNFT